VRRSLLGRFYHVPEPALFQLTTGAFTNRPRDFFGVENNIFKTNDQAGKVGGNIIAVLFVPKVDQTVVVLQKGRVLNLHGRTDQIGTVRFVVVVPFRAVGMAAHLYMYEPSQNLDG
jgi:ribosomal protein L35AE/L33A